MFEGVVEALKKHSVWRKRKLEVAKTTPAKKRKVWLKRKRVLEGKERIKKHGHDTYFGSHQESRSERGECKPRDKLRCRTCGSNTHKRSSHRDCPFNKRSLLCAEKKGHSKSAEDVYRFTSDSDEVSDADLYNIGSLDGASSDSCTSEESVVAVCKCGAERRAHSMYLYTVHICTVYSTGLMSLLYIYVQYVPVYCTYHIYILQSNSVTPMPMIVGI